MAKGYLKVNVYGDNIANPVKNAKVTVLKNNEEVFETTTDENGQTPLISLDTVAKIYSEQEQYNVRPYETYDLKVEALGLNSFTLEGVQIFDGVTSVQDIYLTSIDNPPTKTKEELPPNTLWENVSNSYLEPERPLPEIAPIILKRVEIPSTIIVHDGVPNNSNAPNYQVPFIDYIKNVASNEIYSTWPLETIKANVLAIISFTLNRIYTEWYRSRGYDFTITATSSYDQKYNPNGTIFEPISRVVDEIFNNYLRSGIRLEPLLAKYKSETTEKGVLSQWGSKELGDKGYTALQILKNYYGNDINIYTAPVIDTYPYSFTETLQEGDCSIDVYILQNSLNYIHGSYPGIPLIKNPTGYYNAETTSAVKTFQEVFFLEETGTVNYQTWYKISYILTAIKDLTESIY